MNRMKSPGAKPNAETTITKNVLISGYPLVGTCCAIRHVLTAERSGWNEGGHGFLFFSFLSIFYSF